MSSIDKFLLKHNDENVEIPMVCRLCGTPVKSLTLFTPDEYEYGSIYACLLYEICSADSYFLCEQCINTTTNISHCIQLLHSSRCLNKNYTVIGCFMCGSENCNIFFPIYNTEIENIVLERFLQRYGCYARSTQRICISCSEVFSDLVEIQTVLRDNMKRSKAVQDSEAMLVSKPVQKDTKRVTVCSTYNEVKNQSSEFLIFPFEEEVKDLEQSNQEFQMKWTCSLTPRDDNETINQLDNYLFHQEMSSSSKFIASPLKKTVTSNEDIVHLQQFDNQDQAPLSLQFKKEIESAAFYVPRKTRTFASNITTAQLPKIVEGYESGLEAGDNLSTQMGSTAFHASRRDRSSSSNISPDQLPKILEENPSTSQGGDAAFAGPIDVPLNKYSSKYSISPLQIGSKANTSDETTILDVVTGWRMPRGFFSGKPSVSDYAYLSTKKNTSLDRSSFSSLPEDRMDSLADPIATTSITFDKKEDLIITEINDGTEPSTSEKCVLSTTNSPSDHSKTEVIAKSSSVDQLMLPSLEEIQSFIPRALFVGSIDTLSDAARDVGNKKQDLLPTDSDDSGSCSDA